MANNSNNAKRQDAGSFKQAKRELREGAFILYFESLFRSDDIRELYEVTSECEESDAALRISEESCDLACCVSEKASEIDQIISRFSPKRSVERIPKINLAVLRLAIYEAAYDSKVPVNVAISEAVAIAEKYAHQSDVAFINGVLGSYSRSLNDGEPANE